jgi:tRNA threonylcarbamoyladenosine biosynthesis protein TsaE
MRSAASHLQMRSSSAKETTGLGEQIGRLLQAGDVLLLQGDLGAGKTCLTQGIAHGLGIDDPVCSPTFVLVGQYEGRLRLYHADLYRLDNPAEIGDLDLARSSEDGVLITEWPERAPEWLPLAHLLIRIDHLGGDARQITFSPNGARAECLVEDLQAALRPAAGSS